MRRPPEAVLELLQFVPILTFALPFMAAGAVDLGAAGGGFVRATLIALAVMGLLKWLDHPQNPIHVATNGWLLVGALAFAVPVSPLTELYAEWGALSLFGGVALWGGVQLGSGRGGFLLGSVATTRQLRVLTPVMIGLLGLAMVWAWIFQDNLRLGGGLPFITLNVVRRVLLKRVS